MARRSLEGVRMHVIVPRPQKQALDSLSKKTGLAAAEHLRRALDLYLQSLDLRSAK